MSVDERRLDLWQRCLADARRALLSDDETVRSRVPNDLLALWNEIDLERLQVLRDSAMTPEGQIIDRVLRAREAGVAMCVHGAACPLCARERERERK